MPSPSNPPPSCHLWKVRIACSRELAAWGIEFKSMSVEGIACIGRRSSDYHPYELQNFGRAAVGSTIHPDCDAFVGSISIMSPPRYQKRRTTLTGAVFVILSTLLMPLVAAQQTGSCISLATSRTCTAFNSSSISTSNALVGNLYDPTRFVKISRTSMLILS